MTGAIGVAVVVLAAQRAAAQHAHGGAPATAARGDSALLARGRQVVQTTCAACHTEGPPMKAAPPFRMVAMHYRRALPDSAAVVQRITQWIAAPDSTKSLLPPMARRRFGLMPALPISEAERRAAAVYVQSLGMPTGSATP
ncbi:MAG TPA: c-type cytochrome [Gemmatimonadaceae bacterium]|nr:c-type cytochrome [Gemmatimonadaceae bacterium]